MTIKVGTLCIVIGNHPLAGKCVETTGPLERAVWYCPTTNDIRGGPCYPIAHSSRPPVGSQWVAHPSELIPIAPPGFTDDERTSEPAGTWGGLPA